MSTRRPLPDDPELIGDRLRPAHHDRRWVIGMVIFFVLFMVGSWFLLESDDKWEYNATETAITNDIFATVQAKNDFRTAVVVVIETMEAEHE